MCDCYVDKCRVCGEEIEMHLGDFSTGQDEVEVYCGVHLPSDGSDGMVWEYRDGGPTRRAFVRWLTPNARENASGNHPNYAFVEPWGFPEGVLAVSDEESE